MALDREVYMARIDPVAPSDFYNTLLHRTPPVSRAQTGRNSIPDQASSLRIDDVLDLSPLAQSILDQLPVNNNSGVFGSSSLFGFYLTQAQEEQIAEILKRHRGEPFNQETFDSILADLEAVGLGPLQLAAQDTLQFYDPFATLLGVSGTINSNTDFFANTLNVPLTTATFPNQQANINAYLLRIMTQFLGITLVH